MYAKEQELLTRKKKYHLPKDDIRDRISKQEHYNSYNTLFLMFRKYRKKNEQTEI